MSWTRVWDLRSGSPEAPWPLDRGLRYGMAVFETIAVKDGRPRFFEEHAARLNRAARELLGAEVEPLLERARAIARGGLHGDGVLRVYATAGPGGLLDGVDSPGGFAMFEECEVGSGPGEGARLMVHAAPCCPAPGGWKTANYWQNARALAEARARGADEAVLLNPAGEVVGCACANLFVVIGGRLRTPPLASGARDGVVRAWVKAKAGAEECPLSVEDLASADAVFYTNSRRGIVSVAALDGRRVPDDGTAARLAAAHAALSS